MKSVYSKGRKPFANKEEFDKYYIGSAWFKTRKPGISAMMRSFKDERWIGPVLESILPFFDEIIVAYTDGGDRTRKIIESFESPKIKICEYPFKLKINKRDWNSIYNLAYFSNWGLSKTNFTHYSPWDADMILLPKFCEQEWKNYILENNVVHARGYNVATSDFKYMSADIPYITYDIRFIKLNEHIFYECTKKDYEEWSYRGLPQLFNPLRWITHTHTQYQRARNWVFNNDVTIFQPMYLHTKPLIMTEGIEKEKSSHTVGSQYIGIANKGEEIKEDIPDFVFKKPEDYL